jgi:hypothetical protein
MALAEASAAARMVREINRLAPIALEPTEASEQLAEAYLRAGVIPAKKRDDARHVSIATVAGLPMVVSWNHRHLANERKRTLFNAVNRPAGYEQVLLIHTPFVVLRSKRSMRPSATISTPWTPSRSKWPSRRAE